MLLPRIWDEDLFENMDNWMSWPDESEFFGKKNPLYGKHAKNLMKTDVRETEDAYEVDIDLPGFKKDEVTITVENGVRMEPDEKSCSGWGTAPTTAMRRQPASSR